MKRPHHRPSPWMICLVPTLLIGCGPEDPPPSSEEPGEMVADMGMGMEDVGEAPDPDESEDMEEDAPPPDQDDDMGADMPPACEPLEQCPADTCGMVEDTCGGMLDCGACACEDGTLTLTEDACGPCGLGRLTCDAGQTGAATCSIEGDLYGLSAALSEEECASTLLYVDHAASGPQTGEPASPFATYAQAQAEATEGQVIVLARGGPYKEVLDLKEEVSVIGGLIRAQDRWTYDPEGVSGFVAPAPTDDISVGIRAIDIQEPTTLAQVRMIAADAPTGWSSYGLMAVDSSGLTLERVEAQSGAGGTGREATPGVDGAAGDQGQQAHDYTPAYTPGGRSPRAGGTNPDCPAANGGQGGIGEQPCGSFPLDGCLCSSPTSMCLDQWASHQAVTASTSGQTGAGSKGGAGGIPTFSPQASLDLDAGDGDHARPADSGMSGSSARLEDARFVRAPDTTPSTPVPSVGVYWDPGRASDGTPGEDGSGGGGGGGTRFAYVHTTGGWNAGIQGYGGALGAGGGAGGCGGTAGQGGGSGHASMGAAFISSQVTLRDSSFRAGPGGRGAPGADGGRGGAPGRGGEGSEDKQFTKNNSVGAAGAGGDGSAGGRGGQGGPGAGGPSYGLYCLESLPTLDDASTYEAGAAGPGAQNGVTVLGEPVLGPDGEALDQKGCM